MKPNVDIKDSGEKGWLGTVHLNLSAKSAANKLKLHAVLTIIMGSNLQGVV